MGATTFYNTIKGDNPSKAFKSLVEEALYMEGHGGYTGTIAEKHDFKMSRKPKDVDPDLWVQMLDDFDEDDRQQDNYYALKKDFDIYDDKWGPALCIPIKGGYLFCGWASC